MNVPSTFEAGNRGTLDKKRSSTSKPTLVYFTEPNSNLCQLLNPDIENVCSRLTQSLEFVAVDVSEHKDLSYEFKVMSCPSFVIMREGREIRRLADVEYSNDFQDLLRHFLLGDFHFDDSPFQILDSMNFRSRLGAGFQIDIVLYLKPAQPENWELVPVLEDLLERHQSKVRFSLVNARRDNKLLDHFTLQETPAAVGVNEGTLIGRWNPVENPQEFANECDRLIL